MTGESSSEWKARVEKYIAGDRDFWESRYMREHRKASYLESLLERLVHALGDPQNPRNSGNSEAYHKAASLIGIYINQSSGDRTWFEPDWGLLNEGE